jgi:hypothetical protein
LTPAPSSAPFYEHHGSILEARTATLVVGSNRLQLEQIGMAGASQMKRVLFAAIAPRTIERSMQLGLTLQSAARTSNADKVISFAFKLITVTYPLERQRRVKITINGEINWVNISPGFLVAPAPLHLLKPEAGMANANRS